MRNRRQFIANHQITYIAFSVAASFMLVMLSFGAVIPSTMAFTGNSYSDTLRACHNGFTVTSSETLIAPVYDKVTVISSDPPGATGEVLEENTPGAHTGSFTGLWASPQNTGTPVTIHLTVERPDPSEIVLTGAVEDCMVAEDTEGALFFDPDDGRVDPRPGDRVAVYCEPKFYEVDVWGIRPDSRGVPLYLFDVNDVVAAGSQGLSQSLGALGIVSLVVDTQSHFFVSWHGGIYNATGAGDFTKSFYCLFPGSTVTPDAQEYPTRTRRFHVPVYTVTPVPTSTPSPTYAWEEKLP